LFQEHIGENHEGSHIIYFCKSCSLYTPTVHRAAAERHATFHSIPKKRARERSFIYEYNFCEQKHHTKKAHVMHYQENHSREGVEKLQCIKCFKSFDTTPSLKVHIKTVHMDLKSFECKECGKKVRDQFNLQVHMRSHSNLCSTCGKNFGNKHLLI
jgi:hypothetical protein